MLSPVKDNQQDALDNRTIRSSFSLFSCRVPARNNFSRVFAAAPLHWTRRWRSTAIKVLSRFLRKVNATRLLRSLRALGHDQDRTASDIPSYRSSRPGCPSVFRALFDRLDE